MQVVVHDAASYTEYVHRLLRGGGWTPPLTKAAVEATLSFMDVAAVVTAIDKVIRLVAKLMVDVLKLNKIVMKNVAQVITEGMCYVL